MDIQGSPRLNDADTADAGAPQFAVETDLGSSQFNPTGGSAQNWRSFGARWQYNLPFTFNFAGIDYNDVWVSSSGFLQFGSSTNAGDTTNSTAEFDDYPRIAPLWDQIATNATGDDIYVDTSVADQVTIRWDGRYTVDNSEAQFAVTLFATGSVEFHYGPGNTNLTPTIGLSGYEDRHFSALLASYDGLATLTNANSLRFDLAPGYVDIGAYEFRGESSDVVPPRVVDAQARSLGDQTITTIGIDNIDVVFTEEVNNIDASAPAAFDLRASGPNGLFGDGDDVVFSALPSFVLGDHFVTLDIAEGILPPGDYRLRLFSGIGRSIHDTAGLRLDGDGDGVEGGDFERFFTVAINQQPTAGSQNVQATEDTELSIVLDGDDGDPALVQNLTYWLTSLPTNGTLATSPGGTALQTADLPIAVPAQLYFTPALDSVAPEGFDFYVQDDGSVANGGVDISAPAAITITILPVNDPPEAVDLDSSVVTENVDTSAGDLLVGNLSASDVDLGDSHTYQLVTGSGDTDNASFVIVGNALYLRQNSTVDYEEQSLYNIRVAAEDSGGATVEQPLTIDVLNLTEVAAIRYDDNLPDNHQRSILGSITIIFDQLVTASTASFEFLKLDVTPNPAAVDFGLTLADVGGVTEATLTFGGQYMNPSGNSLIDGYYQLTVFGSTVTDQFGQTLDGDRDGIEGGDYVIGATEADALFRRFGDSDGDGDLDGQDYGRAGASLFKLLGDPGFNPVFDEDGDGDMDGQDYGRLAARLFRDFPFPF